MKTKISKNRLFVILALFVVLSLSIVGAFCGFAANNVSAASVYSTFPEVPDNYGTNVLRPAFKSFILSKGEYDEATLTDDIIDKIGNNDPEFCYYTDGSNTYTYVKSFILAHIDQHWENGQIVTTYVDDLFKYKFHVEGLVNAGKNDVLTDKGAEALKQCFGVDKDVLLMEGSSIRNANQETHTAKFKAYEEGMIKAGGESVNAADGDFSIIVMGDQQTAVEYHSKYVASAYNWIRDNATAMNLKAFISVGDIVDDTNFIKMRELFGNPWFYVNYNSSRLANYKEQLQFAANQAEKLLGNGYPVVMTMGNHDYQDMADSYRIKDNFISAFPIEKYGTEANGFVSNYNYEVKDESGATIKSSNDIEASAYQFEANGQKYLIVTLGNNPTDAMLGWANELVASEQYKDYKVIVSTHDYIMGRNTINGETTETRDYTEVGRHVWNNFVSLHENIFMVVCGHECTSDGTVIKRVNYGVNGNAVTQFLIDPQVEEFGGSGLISQLIFRADGTVDFVYFSPYAEELSKNDNVTVSKPAGGYFMAENQFSYIVSPEKLTATTAQQKNDSKNLKNITVFSDTNYVEGSSAFKSWEDEKVDELTKLIGKDNIGDIHIANGTFTYLGNEKLTSWLDNLYAKYNVSVSGKGITNTTDVENETFGYVTHLFYVGDTNYRFNKLSLKLQGSLNSSDGFVQVDLSSDGKTYETALYINNTLGAFDQFYLLDDYLSANSVIYVRIYVKNATVSKLFYEEGKVKTVFDDKSAEINIDFDGNELPNYMFNLFDFEDVDGNIIDGCYSSYNTVYSGGMLGTGAPGKYAYKGQLVFRFDSGVKGRNIEQLNIQLNMRVVNPYNDYSEFAELDTDFYIRVLLSYDNGKTYNVVDGTTHKVDELTFIGGVAENVKVNIPVKTARNTSSVMMKIETLGAGASFCQTGIRNIKIFVVHNSAISTVEYTKSFEYNGGSYYEDYLKPAKSGYIFDGWYTNEDFNGKAVDPTDAKYDNVNVTFYAKWTRNYYKIVYVLDGGTNSEYNVEHVGANEYLKLFAASKDGKAFAGWYDSDGNKVETVMGKNLSDDLVLYAVWTDEVAKSGCSGNLNGMVYLTALIPLAALFIVAKRKFAKK